MQSKENPNPTKQKQKVNIGNVDNATHTHTHTHIHTHTHTDTHTHTQTHSHTSLWAHLEIVLDGVPDEDAPLDQRAHLFLHLCKLGGCQAWQGKAWSKES